MKFQMERKHIDHGKPSVCSACPVALVLNETTGVRGWNVSDYVIWHDKAFDKTIATPPAVKLFMDRFDCYKRCKPIAFELPDDIINFILKVVKA